MNDFLASKNMYNVLYDPMMRVPWVDDNGSIVC